MPTKPIAFIITLGEMAEHQNNLADRETAEPCKDF